MIRNDLATGLLSYMSQGHIDEEIIDKFRSCIVTKNDADIVPWLVDCIGSLYYKPNMKLLVLCGEDSIDKNFFIRHLLPPSLCITSEIIYDQIYERFIVEVNHYSEGKDARSDGFVVRNPYTEQIYTDKRLASYILSVENWKNPQRESVLFVDIESIDIELYKEIDKRTLWVEIFKKFHRDAK